MPEGTQLGHHAWQLGWGAAGPGGAPPFMETSQGPEARSKASASCSERQQKGSACFRARPSLCKAQGLETLIPAGDDRLGCGDKWQAVSREPSGAHLGLSVTGTHSNPGLF